VWDVDTTLPRLSFRGKAGGIASGAFSPDGRLLATGAWTGAVELWDVAKGEAVSSLRGHTGAVRTVLFLEGGKTLATGSEDGTIKLWDVAKRAERRTLREHSIGVYALAVSPDGKTLVSGSGDYRNRKAGEVLFWDVADGQQKPLKIKTEREVWALSFSPDGKTLAASVGTGKVSLWDVETGNPKGVVSTPFIRPLAFAPSGRYLATASGIDTDSNVRLWDTTTWNEKAVLVGHQKMVFSLRFTADGKTLASASKDGTVRLWPVPTAGAEMVRKPKP